LISAKNRADLSSISAEQSGPIFLAHPVYEAGRKAELRVNIAKTKIMEFGSTKIESHIELEV